MILILSSYFSARGSLGTGTGTHWRSEAADEVATLARRQSVVVELISAQTQTSDFPDIGDSFDDEANMIRGGGGMNGGIGYGSGYDESFSSTTISYPSGVDTGSPTAVDNNNFRTLSPLQFGTLHSVNSYEMESVEMGYSGQNQREHGTSAGDKGNDPLPLASEVIRVDCVLLTTNGRYVVTGSIYGPPQVWDIKVGFHRTTPYQRGPGPRSLLKKGLKIIGPYIFSLKGIDFY